jgi:restriction endonuclease S subunit
MVSSSWTRDTLGGIAASDYGLVDGPFGSNLPASDYTSVGVPVIRGSNLSLCETRFKGDDFVYVAETTAARLSRSLCKPDDIIFTKKGTIGQTGIIPKNLGHTRFLLSSNQMKLTVNEKKAVPLFVYYVVSSPESRDKILQDASVTGVPKINLAYIRQFPILLPHIDEQREIVSVLAAFDGKIEQLQAQSTTLETVSRAIFKSWFVDFDPVRAKAEGREPEGMDAATAAHFPSEFRESELGLIPNGWSVSAFDDAVIVTSGGTPKTTRADFWGGQIPWFSIADAPSASEVFVINTEKAITAGGLDSCSARLLPVGATIISARGTVGKLAVTGVEMAINQSCYALLPQKLGSYATFFQAGRLVDVLRQRAHGAVFSTITRETLSSVSVIIPSRAIAATFDQEVGPLMQRILNNRKMAKTLTQLRDTLLPRLISGKLRVPVAETMMETAL